MTIAVLLALAAAIIFYLAMGFRFRQSVKGLGDMLPILHGKSAHVANTSEFSNSVSAAALSLATVVVAYFELVPALGWFLVWPALTTGLGLLCFGAISGRVWRKMEGYSYRPTLHQYLGTEFDNKAVALIASIATVCGYLATFSVELLVGGRFIAALVPAIPEWIIVGLITVVIITYTSVGGFRVTIVTDKHSMKFVWLLLLAMGAYYMVYVGQHGWAVSVQRIPEQIRTIHWNSGMLAFIWGIAIMNLFTYISNMGLWQRIAGTEHPETVTKGMWNSALQSAVSWSLLAAFGVGSFMLVTPVEGENILITLMRSMEGSVFGVAVIFCMALGLLAALLSTGSTLLIACVGTVSEDLLAPLQRQSVGERASSRREMLRTRMLLVGSGVLAIVVVELLRLAGFSVADLAFIVYGAALGLVPPILISLFMGRSITRRLSVPAILAVALGFISSWAAGAYGKSIGDGNLVFLSPLVSTVVATVIMVVGWLFVRKSA